MRVVHLTQLFRDVERPALDPLVVRGVVQQGVVVDQVDLPVRYIIV